MAGRRFNGQTVEAQFFSELLFSQGKYTEASGNENNIAYDENREVSGGRYEEEVDGSDMD